MKAIILRGLPGAGKSTWVAKNAPDAVVCSADDFLMQDGQYVWTPERLARAHFQCEELFAAAVAVKKPLIVVDNCNLRARDIRVYTALAFAGGYQIEIRTLRVDPEVAIKRNQHGCPPEKYPSLVARFKNPLPVDLAIYELIEVGE